MKGLDLAVSSFTDVKDHSYQMAILPWGATEPHNMHLPYLTDSILSHRIAVDAVVAAQTKGVNCMVLPPVNMGSQNPGQRDELFCIHTRYQTQYAILCDIVESLYYQGIDKLLIVNGHGGNNFKNMIRDLAVDKPAFTIATLEWYTIIDAKPYFDEVGDHAGELETSAMLYYHPEYVDMATAGAGAATGFAIESLKRGKVWIPRNWKQVSTDTGIGDPRAASAEKGRNYVQDVVVAMCEIIVDLSTKELYTTI